jgi:hypothetical protein
MVVECSPVEVMALLKRSRRMVQLRLILSVLWTTWMHRLDRMDYL